MAKNITEVVIAGKIISISGEEDSAYMTEVAAFINDKLQELQKTDNYGKLSAEYKQILLGMNLADEYFRLLLYQNIFAFQLVQQILILIILYPYLPPISLN